MLHCAESPSWAGGKAVEGCLNSMAWGEGGGLTAMPASETLASRVAGCSTMRSGVMRMLLPVVSTPACF